MRTVPFYLYPTQRRYYDVLFDILEGSARDTIYVALAFMPNTLHGSVGEHCLYDPSFIVAKKGIVCQCTIEARSLGEL